MKEKLKISNFKTPQDYFENFEEQLFERLQLEDLPKSSGLKVPEGYFNQLEDKIVAEEIASRQQSKVIRLFPRKYYGYAAAIAAVFILGVSIFISNDKSNGLDNIQMAYIDQYIEDGNLNMDLNDLTSYMENQEISAMDFDYQFIPQTEMKNYLLEHTDESLLMDHLY